MRLLTNIGLIFCAPLLVQAGEAAHTSHTSSRGPNQPPIELVVEATTTPSAPKLLSASTGSDSVTMVFSTPATDGGSPITSYTGTCTAAGQPTPSATGVSSPITIHGLKADVRYACAVSANNSTGSSPPSDPAAAIELSGMSKLAAGLFHTCMVTATEGVKCWGDNSNGQLGSGSTQSSPLPVDVAGLASGVKAISAGEWHTCALTTAGGVKCWGLNNDGQLGNGSTVQSRTPVDVSGLASGVAGISTGTSHTCARTTSGGVKCWGGNAKGQIGNGTTTNQYVPVTAYRLNSGVAAVDAGPLHTCMVAMSGGANCWGNNVNGQLGTGTTVDSAFPVNLSGRPSDVTSIVAAQYHSCAITTAGGVMCWGDNTVGQLGNNTTVNTLNFTFVSGISGGTKGISAYYAHTCVVTGSDGVKCWGSNSNGQLGNNSTVNAPAPVDVSGLQTGVMAVSAGLLHTCALTTSGVKCWGDNSRGQLGNGSTTTSLTPVGVQTQDEPTCRLNASSNLVPAGTKVVLSTVCGAPPAAYVWTNAEISPSAFAGEITPFFTGIYSVQAVDASGRAYGNIASTTITVTDTITLPGPRSNYAIISSSTGLSLKDATSIRTLTGIKRLKFTDTSIALDVVGTAGKVYRLYQAAFNRVPETAGLGFHMADMEVYSATHLQVAQHFIDSLEFFLTYGTTTDEQFVTLLYANVLKRFPDEAGLAFYLDRLASKEFTRAQVLVGFSESPENQALVLPAIKMGMQYNPSGGN